VADSPERMSKQPQSRRERARALAMFGLGGLAALFAVLNFDKVDVNWLLGTWSTPLIVVIAISFLLGAGVGLLVGRRRGNEGLMRERRRT
jgi:uncharacterized integral membrane protein